MTASSTAARAAAIALAGAPLYGIALPLRAQTTPGTQPVAGAGSPTPPVANSGWSDIGLWGVIGLVVAAVIVLVLVLHRRRSPR